MIASPDGTIVLSSLGWVERDAVWELNVATGQTRTIPLGTGARYASLHSDGADLFAVGHHFDGPRFEVSGDLYAWSRVPCLYPEFLSFSPYGDYVLIQLSPVGSVRIQRLDRFDDSYDKGYQGVVGALALRNGGRELWAKDCDTVVVLSTDDWRVLRSARLQQAAKGSVSQFIGALAFLPGGDECLVARPFSGDVLAIDSQSLKATRAARVGREPLTAIMSREGEVIARDWKTGDVLRARLKPRWF